MYTTPDAEMFLPAQFGKRCVSYCERLPRAKKGKFVGHKRLLPLQSTMRPLNFVSIGVLVPQPKNTMANRYFVLIIGRDSRLTREISTAQITTTNLAGMLLYSMISRLVYRRSSFQSTWHNSEASSLPVLYEPCHKASDSDRISLANTGQVKQDTVSKVTRILQYVVDPQCAYDVVLHMFIYESNIVPMCTTCNTHQSRFVSQTSQASEDQQRLHVFF